MKLINKTALSMMVGLACASAAVQAEPGRISDNVLRIGVLTDMSNIYALNAGPGAVIAARMAVEDFGKKTINGARIEILTADDQNRQDIAAARTKTWIEKDKVDMITGSVSSAAALGSIGEASKLKKPVFATSSTSTGLTNASCSPYTIHWMQDTYGLSIGTVKALIESGKKSFYFITADYAFGWALEKDASDMVRALGGEVKGSIRAPFPGADFTDQLLAAKESGAQVVAFANAGLDAVGTTLQANKLGLNRTQVVAPLLLFHQDVQSLGASVLQDQLMTIGYVWNQSPESIEFAKRYYARTHRMPDVGQAGVYSSVLQYLKAVEATGSDDGETIMKYFKTPGVKINDAIIKDGYVRADGKMMKPMYLLRIKKPADMKHEWDYYIIKKVISAEEAAISAEKSTCPLLNPNAAKPAGSAAAPAVVPAAKPAAALVATSAAPAPAMPAAPAVAASAVTKPADSTAPAKDAKAAPASVAPTK